MTSSLVSRCLAKSKQTAGGLLRKMPSRCPLCQMAARGGHLCAGCEADIFDARQRRSLCRACGAELSISALCGNCVRGAAIDALACAIDYQFTGQLLIQMYKEGGQLALANLLGDLMVRAAKPLFDELKPDAWVPIPASAARLGHTGFSPAQQLARVVASLTATPCRLEWLAQVRDGSPQKTLGRFERLNAVKGRFVANAAVAGLCIGLVDDVVTTSSTVAEAARTLKAAGAKRVIVLAAARTPLSA
ncbi:MAG: ComF family protein [Burkholderiaceae bacterium]|nr:ComF family protein [Burkholderiaceae bacterium]MCD8517407.1 ComF family protein [Burkholderiaceae bacterium]MCD8536203.1 ComF family protein [Burkholderiaceae bacterium]MCD8564980.1 ComF family protein [Burkholderiaceae bacterium]